MLAKAFRHPRKMQRIEIKALQSGIDAGRVRFHLIGDGAADLLQRQQKPGRHVGQDLIACVRLLMRIFPQITPGAVQPV